MLVTYDQSKHGPIATGPVDPMREERVDDRCPYCQQPLLFIPEQNGRCHSGRYATRILLDHWECDNEDCETHGTTDALFIYEKAAPDQCDECGGKPPMLIGGLCPACCGGPMP